MIEHPEKRPVRKRALRNQVDAPHLAARRAKRPIAPASDCRKDRAKPSDASAKEKAKRGNCRTTLWTVGHSTRSVADFIALLCAHGIQQLVDVRTIPRSRHNPQFNYDCLPESLKQAGVHYLHMPALGGLRHARRDSINTAWRNASFRGFADYMQTPEFDLALKDLIRVARNRRTAIMCAEAVPWRCHRSLISDALLIRGFNVEEITSVTGTRPHILIPWSCVVGQRITYPAGAAEENDRTRKSRDNLSKPNAS